MAVMILKSVPFSFGKTVVITSTRDLVDFKLNDATRLVTGQVEILQAQIDALSDILAGVLETAVPEELLLDAVRLYGYERV